MKALLDTHICRYIIRRKPENALKRFKRFELGEVGASSITVAEMEYGAAKSRERDFQNSRVEMGELGLIRRKPIFSKVGIGPFKS